MLNNWDNLEVREFAEAAIHSLLGRAPTGPDTDYLVSNILMKGRKFGIQTLISSPEFKARFLSDPDIRNLLLDAYIEQSQKQIKHVASKQFDLVPIGIRLWDFDIGIYDFPPFQATKWIIEELQRDDYSLKNLIINDGDVIFDIGGHVGMFSILCAKLFPKAKIYTVEAVKATFELLCENLKINLVDNITPLNFAVSASEGTRQIAFSPHSNSGASSGVFAEDAPKWSVVDAKAATINEIIKDHKIERIALLKIDCEGMEYEILYSPEFPWNKIDRIAMEIHESETLAANGFHADELIKLLYSKLGKENVVYTRVSKDGEI